MPSSRAPSVGQRRVRIGCPRDGRRARGARVGACATGRIECGALARDAADLGVPITVKATVGEALACARMLAGADDTICVTGSLLVAGEAKAMLEGTTVSGLRG